MGNRKQIVESVMEMDIPIDHAVGSNEKVMADCFKALAVALLGEWLMSSDAKLIVFYGMLSNLEAYGYTEEQIEQVKEATNKIIRRFMKTNDFMG